MSLTYLEHNSWLRLKGEEVGQKVHPYGFRLGYNKDWHSHWFAKKQFGEFLLEDLKLKRDLKQRFAGAGVSHVDIERAANRLKIIIYTSRPGIIIGRKGAEIDKLKSDLSSKTGREVLVSIQEIHKPELNAQLQAEKIATQLEKRIAFRRAMRKAVEESLRFGAKGIKVKVSGRLNGAEIARSEWHLQGQLPLHTLRADIDYGLAEARTTFGQIGVKVWIYRGEIMDPKAAMARGTGSDPINETRLGGRERRPRTRREREGDRTLTSGRMSELPAARRDAGKPSDREAPPRNTQSPPIGRGSKATVGSISSEESSPSIREGKETFEQTMLEAYGVARIRDHEKKSPLYINQVYVLETGVRCRIPDGFDGEAALMSLPLGGSEMRLDITVDAAGIIIEPDWHQTLTLKRGQDSELREFNLIPEIAGLTSIRIDFYHQGLWLSRIKIDVEVAQARSAAV